MAGEAWDDARFDREWGTRQQVYAAYMAGWPIDEGPPPAGPDAHGLPPENSTPAVNPDGQEFHHNGIEPTDAEPLFPTHPSTQVGGA